MATSESVVEAATNRKKIRPQLPRSKVGSSKLEETDEETWISVFVTLTSR